MTIEEALTTIETALHQERLSKVQELVFRQSWEGQSYPEIGESSGYNPDYIRDAGSKLWQLLSKVFGERITKKNFRPVLQRRLLQTQASATLPNRTGIDISNQRSIQNQADWGEAIDVLTFYGRIEELTKLEQWIINDRCRLVALLGMGGMGKTALAVKLAEQVQDQFEYLIWRSLRNAPPIEEILANLIQFLSSNQQKTQPSEPLDTKVSQLIKYLQQHRCLLVLDNAESILRSGECVGHYREGYEGYGQLFKRISEAPHQSCLVLTSREKPKEIAVLEGEKPPVCTWQLTGLKETAAQEVFKLKGSFSGAADEWRTLIKHYAGNPLALKMVAPAVQDFFEGDIAQFLRFIKQGTFVFDDIRDLLDRQFNRLSVLEKQVMYWLAIAREWVSLSELQADILSSQNLIPALQSLLRRSLIEKESASFTQQPVVMEYVTALLIEQACEAIITEDTSFLISYALVKADAKDFIRESQIRVILEPIAKRLSNTFRSKKEVERKLNRILAKLRSPSISSGGEAYSASPGYAAGNIINLFRQLKIDLTGYDFSNLTVWQAYLQDVNLHQVNFQNADLAKSVFTQTFSSAYLVASIPHGKLLTAGDASDEVRLWRTAEGNARSNRPYESMNIMRATGLTEVQKVTLKTLGAVEAWRGD